MHLRQASLIIIASSLITFILLNDAHASGRVMPAPTEAPRTLRSVESTSPSILQRLLPEKQTTVLPKRDDADDELAYYDEARLAYFMTLPNDYGDQNYFTRFTPDEGPYRIVGLKMVLHDLFGEAGHPDMRISIHQSDGDYPGREIESIVIPTDDLVLSEDGHWLKNEFIFEDYGQEPILFEEADDFHIVINVAQNNDTDTLAPVLDEGREDIDRSGMMDGFSDEWVLMIDLQGIERSLNFAMTAIVEYGDARVTQTISLREGWNTISLRLSPADVEWVEELGPDVWGMIEQFGLEGGGNHVIMLKDHRGRFCAPANGILEIPYWDLSEAYMIKVDSPVDGEWSGAPIEAVNPIPLTAGWNMVPYYPEYEFTASAPDFPVVVSIIDNLIVAKNDEGNFILPELAFSNMPDWKPGEGYHIKVIEECMLRYPALEDRLQSTPPTQIRSPHHWVIGSNRSGNMSVLINSLSNIVMEDGAEIGAFDSNGELVGAGVVINGRCGLAIWGDDPATDAKDGLYAGEVPQFRLSQPGEDEERLLTLTMGEESSSLSYAKDRVIVSDATVKKSLPEIYALINVHPNPFNSSANVEYVVASAGKVSVLIYDTNGKVVANLFEGFKSIGSNSALINGDGMAAGLYFLKVTAGRETAMERIVLLK